MIKGSVVTACVAVVSICVVFTTFLNNASPYVTMAQARKMNDDHLHLAGDLLKDSVTNDFHTHQLRFKIRDSDGVVVQIIHNGEIPANLSEATKIVAIGGVKGDAFVSEKLLVKCPSKYEEQKTPAPGAA